mmetsp:Transcript_16994/g.54443  ORF Transcript_16994/g.54443 Transcript_16994/m.54443 type:complete len:284 (-) Transcript_16994:25-876(-)
MAPDPSASGGQLKALERLSEYPQRMARLKALWIDVNGGGQLYMETMRSRRTSAASRSPSGDRQRSTPAFERPRSPSADRQRPAPAQDVAATPLRPRPEAKARPAASPFAPKRVVRPAASAASGPERGRGASPRGARGGQPSARSSHSPQRGRPSAPARASREPRPAQPQQGPLTAAQIRELMNRDLTPEDYELLLLLDEGVKRARTLTSGAAAALSQAPPCGSWVGDECRICLCALEAGEDVRVLPACGHAYHGPCVERWLSSSRATCPLCGTEVPEVTSPRS